MVFPLKTVEPLIQVATLDEKELQMSVLDRRDAEFAEFFVLLCVLRDSAVISSIGSNLVYLL